MKPSINTEMRRKAIAARMLASAVAVNPLEEGWCGGEGYGDWDVSADEEVRVLGVKLGVVEGWLFCWELDRDANDLRDVVVT